MNALGRLRRQADDTAPTWVHYRSLTRSNCTWRRCTRGATTSRANSRGPTVEPSTCSLELRVFATSGGFRLRVLTFPSPHSPAHALHRLPRTSTQLRSTLIDLFLSRFTLAQAELESLTSRDVQVGPSLFAAMDRVTAIRRDCRALLGGDEGGTTAGQVSISHRPPSWS